TVDVVKARLWRLDVVHNWRSRWRRWEGLLTAGPGPATHPRRPRARSGGQHNPTPRPDSARRWPTPPFERSQPDADTPPTEKANSRATTAFKRLPCRLGSVPHGAAPLADGDDES